MPMTYEDAQGAAALTTLEILCRLLVKAGAIPAAEFQGEMERYAEMHDVPASGGARAPQDPEVARAIRTISRGAVLP
jgi:hypothetical protein